MSDLSVTKASALEKLNVGNLFKENYPKYTFPSWSECLSIEGGWGRGGEDQRQQRGVRQSGRSL